MGRCADAAFDLLHRIRPCHPRDEEHGGLGSPVSHGCVRLAPDNAALLFTLVQENGLANTQVDIMSSAWVVSKPYEFFGVIGDKSANTDFESFLDLMDGR